MAETEAEKKNAVHIRRMSEFADQLFAMKSTVKTEKDIKTNGSLRPAIASVLRDIRSNFNNREMSLVCTKLEEASHWAIEGDVEQVRIKLTEARGWIVAYIDVLKTD